MIAGAWCTSAGLAQGAWSDGMPVTPLLLTIDALPACPAGSHALGC
jgi:hypothetical protein